MKTTLPKLTKIEQKYFDMLLKYSESGVARSTLADFHESVWNSNVVDVHMKNLRAKLAGIYEIEAVRGFGYKMRPV